MKNESQAHFDCLEENSPMEPVTVAQACNLRTQETEWGRRIASLKPVWPDSERLSPKSKGNNVSVVAHLLDPSTGEVEAGESGIQGYPQLPSKSEASLDYMKSYLLKIQNNSSTAWVRL